MLKSSFLQEFRGQMLQCNTFAVSCVQRQTAGLLFYAEYKQSTDSVDLIVLFAVTYPISS